MGGQLVHAVAFCSETGFLLTAVTQHSYTSTNRGLAEILSGKGAVTVSHH